MIEGPRDAEDASDVGGQSSVAQNVVREQQVLQALRIGLPLLRRQRRLADPVNMNAAAGIDDRARLLLATSSSIYQSRNPVRV